MAIDVDVAASFLLVLARTGAWIVVAPFFSAKGISAVGKLAFAIGLAIFLAPLQADHSSIPDDPAGFIVVLVGQVLIGLALGWATGLLFHAFEVAGQAMDVSSGFSIGAVFDPVTGNSAPVFARFSNLLFMVLLVVTNAHLTLVEGFVRSYGAIPADQFPVLASGAGPALGHAVTMLLLAALEIGAPVLGALFLTEVGLALATRFVPAANIFAVGMPVKVGIALIAFGAALVYLPMHVAGLVDDALRLGDGIVR